MEPSSYAGNSRYNIQYKSDVTYFVLIVSYIHDNQIRLLNQTFYEPMLKDKPSGLECRLKLFQINYYLQQFGGA